MPVLTYQLLVETPKWKKALPDYEKLIKKIIAAVPGSGEISILLTSDKKIQKLNKQYRGKDKPTNVLSFPQDEPGLRGDIAMALETLEREAIEQDKTLADHFTHLFVHGILHLMGHDHMKKAEQQKMEKLEVEILKQLGIQNPY